MIKLGATVVVNDNLRDAYDRSKQAGSSPQVTFGDYGSIQLGGSRWRCITSPPVTRAATPSFTSPT